VTPSRILLVVLAGAWHGTVTVKQQHFQGHVFSYSGSFSAAWCGKH
jgi:hypothetical protein